MHDAPRRARRLALLALLALASLALPGCVDEPSEERQGWPVGDEDASVTLPRAQDAPRADARAVDDT